MKQFLHLGALILLLFPSLAWGDNLTSIVVKLSGDDAQVLTSTTKDSVLADIFSKFGSPTVSPIFGSRKTDPDWEKDLKKIKERYPARTLRKPSDASIPNLNRFFKLTFDVEPEKLSSLVEKLKKSPQIKSASLDRRVKAVQSISQPSKTMNFPFELPDDPYFFSTGSWGQPYDDLWGLRQIEMGKAWKYTTGDPEVVIAVIDSGLDITHPDISDNVFMNNLEIAENSRDDDENGYIDDKYGYNMVNGDNHPSDDLGHGTHVAGTIAAQGDNGEGIVGMMWSVQILPVKVIDAEGWGEVSDIAEGIVYAADMGADVINLSLITGDEEIVREAIQYAWSSGVVIVAAAGNGGNGGDYCNIEFAPAIYREVITVGSSTEEDRYSWFSSCGPKLDVIAPGGDDELGEGINILSLRAEGTDMDCLWNENDDCEGPIVATDYYRMSGTSMATPHVAGLAGLLLSYRSDLTIEEIRQIIRMTADDIEDDGWDELTGHGRINARVALDKSDTRCEALITYPGIDEVITNPLKVFGVQGYAGGQDFGSYEVNLYRASPSFATARAFSGKKEEKVTGGDLALLLKTTFKGMTTSYLELKVYDTHQTVCGRDIVRFYNQK